MVFNPGTTFTATVGQAVSIGMDLSQCGYNPGDAYEIRDVYNLGAQTAPYAGKFSGAAVPVTLTAADFTPPLGDTTAQCWNSGCSSCSPVPSGCSTHAQPVMSKPTSLLRAFLVRKTN
jgi:hypothetical protein